MPQNIVDQLLSEINELKARVAKLESTERNIDYLVLRDGVPAPSSVSGRAIQYIDEADGDLKIVYGDAVTKVIAADT